MWHHSAPSKHLLGGQQCVLSTKEGAHDGSLWHDLGRQVGSVASQISTEGLFWTECQDLRFHTTGPSVSAPGD
jgi:hypothetical protein